MSGANIPRLQVSVPAEGADNYTAALERAGGTPAAGYCPAPDLSCAGLVLCGGGDIACELFGQEDRGSNPPDLARDRAELALFQAFYGAGKPILGICRGMQIINVALGGTLIQDLPRPQRDFHTWDGADKVHPIACLEGSLLHRLYGPLCSVNSAHHQGSGWGRVYGPSPGRRAACRRPSICPAAPSWASSFTRSACPLPSAAPIP